MNPNLDEIIAVDSEGVIHQTSRGNGSKYCRERKINVDWSPYESVEGRIINGGVYFKCSECRTSGVILSSEFTLDIKRKVGAESYEPLGIEFYNCSNHEGIHEDE